RNAFGTCHASRRLSRKTPSKYALCPRSPAESHPESTFETDPSVLPSESATCPRIPPSRENPSGCRPSLPPVPSAEAATPPPPEHSANAPRVPAALLPHRIPEKSNKMFETSKIHRNSSFNQKNPKLILSVSY